MPHLTKLPFFFLAFVCVQCIDPVNIDPDEPDNILVVDGFITDQEGPFEVVVSLISRFAGTLDGGTERFIKDAEVYLTDQDNNRIDLQTVGLTRTDISNACPTGCCPFIEVVDVVSLGYRTPDSFSGEIGNTYVLNVATRNGNHYQSTPQTMIAGPEIDSVSYRFARLPSSDDVTFGSGVEVYTTWTDPAEGNNFYSWRVNGIYRIETPNNGNCCLYIPGGNGVVCWINEKNLSGNTIAFSDERRNGQSITQRVGFIEDNGLRFASQTVPNEKQYYIEVEQLAISGQAFSFNKLLASQLAIEGSIFDPPPAQLTGNMSNINNPDEIVIGFFGAYSVQRSGTFVNREDLEFIQRFPRPCGDCRVRAGARSETPDVYK